MPSDSQAKLDDVIIVEYNKLEIYNLRNSDGSFFKNTIILPSEGVLSAENVFGIVEDTYFSENPVYSTYTVDSKSIFPQINLSKLPIAGNSDTDILSDINATRAGSTQPVSYNRDLGLNIPMINRFAPTPLSISADGIVSEGKIKITGTSLNLYFAEITYGINFNGLIVDLESEIKEALGVDNLSDSVGIGRVSRLYTLDGSGNIDEKFDLFGHHLLDNSFATEISTQDSSIKNYEFTIP